MQQDFKRGQFVSLTYEGRTVEAMVLLASENGAYLMLGFDAALVNVNGRYAGSMPVIRDDNGIYRDLIANKPVQLNPLSHPSILRHH